MRAVNLSRPRFLFGAAALAASPLLTAASSRPPDAAIAAAVRTEFLHAWNGYARIAWGRDELRPQSATAHDFFADGTTFGLSIVEALDTLYVMELDRELERATRWIDAHLTFDVDVEVSMFEAMIRLVGGLIAGFKATGDTLFLTRARDIADRLMPCFVKSPTGAPYRYVNLRTGAVRGAVSNLAEMGTNLLEYGELSLITGDSRYHAASMRAYEAVMARQSPIGLLATWFDLERGVFVKPDDDAPNPPADSFYEYLWGGWQMLGEARCREWYRSLTAAMMRYHADRTTGALWFRNVDAATGAALTPTQSELDAFYAEILAKGGDRSSGSAYYDAFTTVADRYGLIPESFDFRTLTAIDPGNQLRPEYANAAFDLWFLTNDERFRTTAYRYFLALQTHCRVANGYTIVTDVRTRPMRLGDLLPAYAFAENFKYLYLLFARTPRFDPTAYYLSTEGKILRGLVRAQ